MFRTNKEQALTNRLPQNALDYRGLKCPLPVLKARRALKALPSGAKVVIAADDPASPLDMAHFCDTQGYALEQQDGENASFIFTITKSTS